jgi:cytidylate kinase
LLAKRFKLDLFHQKILNKVAAGAQVSKSVLETLDERGLSILEDWISPIVEDRHLWPDQYLQHLMKVIGTIGKHGRTVIVGRGANFIIPPEGQLRVRVVAPLEMRIQNVAHTYNVTHPNAKRRIIRTESDRRAFIRKYFNADIADPINYDLVINSTCLDLENITDAVGMMMNLQKSG